MIGRLKGGVVSESPDGTVVIDVQGVGYEVLVPLGTLARAPRDAQGQVTLQIHTHVREDALVLYGFADERERTAFRLLMAVAGVGPKIALTILGVLPAAELAATVARGDVKRFQTVPGVGKKIAERLVLELKDKLATGVLSVMDGTGPTVTTTVAATSVTAVQRSNNGRMGQVVDVLVRMGFKPAEAERAVASLKGRESEPLEELVREALRSLAP